MCVCYVICLDRVCCLISKVCIKWYINFRIMHSLKADHIPVYILLVYYIVHHVNQPEMVMYLSKLNNQGLLHSWYQCSIATVQRRMLCFWCRHVNHLTKRPVNQPRARIIRFLVLGELCIIYKMVYVIYIANITRKWF